MNEIISLIEEAPEGGYTAHALGESIFTEADDLSTLEENVRDAVSLVLWGGRRRGTHSSSRMRNQELLRFFECGYSLFP